MIRRLSVLDRHPPPRANLACAGEGGGGLSFFRLKQESTTAMPEFSFEEVLFDQFLEGGFLGRFLERQLRVSEYPLPSLPAVGFRIRIKVKQALEAGDI